MSKIKSFIIVFIFLNIIENYLFFINIKKLIIKYFFDFIIIPIFFVRQIFHFFIFPEFTKIIFLYICLRLFQ